MRFSFGLGFKRHELWTFGFRVDGQSRSEERVPQGLKPAFLVALCAARLKPCPTQNRFGFVFSGLSRRNSQERQCTEEFPDAILAEREGCRGPSTPQKLQSVKFLLRSG